MSTVDTEKIVELTQKIETTINKLNQNIEKLSVEAAEAEKKRRLAVECDGQNIEELYDEETGSYSETYYIVTPIVASITRDGSGNGAEHGANTIAGQTRKDAYDEISNILEMTRNEIPNSIKTIKNDQSYIEDYFSPGYGYYGGGEAEETAQFKTKSNASATNKANNFLKTQNNSAIKNIASNLNTHDKATNSNTTANANIPINSAGSATNSGTRSDNPTPYAAVTTGSLASHSGGGYSSNTGYVADNSELLENETLLDEESIIDVDEDDVSDSISSIITGDRVIPKLSTTNKAVKKSKASAVIPVIAGLTAATAAGLGAKKALDKQKENDEEIKLRAWDGDIETDIDYNDGINQEEINNTNDLLEEKSTILNNELFN